MSESMRRLRTCAALLFLAVVSFGCGGAPSVATEIGGEVEGQTPVPLDFVEVNMSVNGVAAASAARPDSSPELAIDGDPQTAWDSGQSSPQWIEIDLGLPVDIGGLRLTVRQGAEGETVHRVYGKGPAWGDGEYRLLHEFQAATADGQVLEVTPEEPWTGIQFVKIETTQSPADVAWAEIEILPPDVNPYEEEFIDSDEDGLPDSQDWCPETPGEYEDNGC